MLLSILEYNWSRILFVAFLIFSALDVNKDVNRDTTRATTTVTPATTQPPGFQIFETIIGAAADNMAPNTQVGRLEIPTQVYENENPFRYEFYYRGGRFLMDFNNGNYLEVGKRWFHLASIREMMEDFEEFFTKVRFPINPMLDINSDGLYNPIYHYPDIMLNSF